MTKSRAYGCRYAVISPTLDRYGVIESAHLGLMTERHFFQMPLVQYRGVMPESLSAKELRGAILVLEQGLPGRRHLRLLSRLQSQGLATFIAWPHEQAVEVVDRERLASLRRHWLAALLGNRLHGWRESHRAASRQPGVQGEGNMPDVAAMTALARLLQAEVDGLQGHMAGGVTSLRAQSTPEAVSLAEHFSGGLTALERMRGQIADLSQRIAAIPVAMPPPVVVADRRAAATVHGEADLSEVREFFNSLLEDPRPVPLRPSAVPPTGTVIDGTGVYLRLDFWAPLTSGGSYGHTCYQARSLARTCSDFVCVMANRFPLLDQLGVRQTAVPGANDVQTEANLLATNAHYRERLGPLFEALRPRFIFERIVLGNAVGAWLSRRFGIPYIVEYNGSEISMKRSFGGAGYRHEDLLLAAEEAAFRQATLVSVVSDHVANDLLRRGIPEDRILVNPNAVDLESYAPATPEEAQRLRRALGFGADDRVVGFIGTFGGWHGIEVLAQALPVIVAADSRVRILLIGDGDLKHRVRQAVDAAGIQSRVVDVGRVPQEKGAELLKACDILVSPHSRRMVDSPFFGSPTKLFEYMAVGAGIVASDLEQIGLVLSPALRNSDFAAARSAQRAVAVTDQRAVLCRPGDVGDFAEAVLHLVRDPDTCAVLGRNARAAAARYYSWDQHVRNLWLRLAGQPLEGYAADWRAKGGAGGPGR